MKEMCVAYLSPECFEGVRDNLDGDLSDESLLGLRLPVESKTETRIASVCGHFLYPIHSNTHHICVGVLVDGDAAEAPVRAFHLLVLAATEFDVRSSRFRPIYQLYLYGKKHSLAVRMKCSDRK